MEGQLSNVVSQTQTHDCQDSLSESSICQLQPDDQASRTKIACRDTTENSASIGAEQPAEKEPSISKTNSCQLAETEFSLTGCVSDNPGAATSWKTDFSLQTQSYLEQQRKFWPREGKHILAQYDDESIVVYQAFKPEIAEYAVKHQQFGGDHYSWNRMSWIKTNFLWMMYRCGWAAKKNQERVLAIWIPKPAFEAILASAYTARLQKSMHVPNISVRLQWDPDHSPTYQKCARRAIQLGMKGKILQKFGTEWVLRIEDITKFVREQRHILEKKGEDYLMTPTERVYLLTDSKLVAQIDLDVWDSCQATVVKGFKRLDTKKQTEKPQAENVAETSDVSHTNAPDSS